MIAAILIMSALLSVITTCGLYALDAGRLIAHRPNGRGAHRATH